MRRIGLAALAAAGFVGVAGAADRVEAVNKGVKKLRCLLRPDLSFDDIQAMTPDGQ
jgi:hypothetical protein